MVDLNTFRVDVICPICGKHWTDRHYPNHFNTSTTREELGIEFNSITDSYQVVGTCPKCWRSSK
jgi:hypothetical protein